MTVTATTPSRAGTLIATRIVAALLAVSGLAGVTYFTVIDPDAGLWLVPWIDLPVIGMQFAYCTGLLVVAFVPRLTSARRVRIGLAAVGIHVLFSLVKITAYDEPEGVTFLAFDAVLALLLLAAGRRTPERRA